MRSLVWSDELLEEAQRTRDAVAEDLRSLEITGDLLLTGAASLAGMLTKGDIDLHLRVEPSTFRDVVEKLEKVYPVGSAHSWAETLAVFDVPGPRATGLAVTPKDSEHDERFRAAWRALRSDPELRARYNAIKVATVGTASYEERKSEFFSSLAQG